jgi:hypothetical protein
MKTVTATNSHNYFRVFFITGFLKKYLSEKTLPKVQLTKGTKVQQIDVKTKEVIATYNLIMEAIKNVCISRASIKRACTNNEVHSGFL